MARLARLYAPGVTQLVVASFSVGAAQSQSLTPALFGQMHAWLATASHLHNVPVHGWCFDASGVALLATPKDSHGMGRLVQMLGRNIASRLVQGAVFTGRYRSCLLQNGRWVLPALIWLETKPSGPATTTAAESWPWSSAATHIGVRPSVWLTPHADYWACGNTPFDRQAVYRQKLTEGNSFGHTQAIVAALHGQWALGDADFLATIQTEANRRASPLPRGRPRGRPPNTPEAA